MDSTHSERWAPGSAGSAATYRSTRPIGRAAATAAPGPTATVQRTDSASAPGCAPQGSRWLCATTSLCSRTLAPDASGRSMPT